MVRIQELMHTIPFLWLSCTKSHYYGAIFCEALVFFFVSKTKESADMSSDVIPTRRVMSSGMVWMTEFDEISGQHSWHFHNVSAHVGTTCHLAGSGDMTWCRHFQLSAEFSQNSFQNSKDIFKFEKRKVSGFYQMKVIIIHQNESKKTLVLS